MAVSPVSQKHQAAHSSSAHKTQTHTATPAETRKSQANTTPNAVQSKHQRTAIEQVNHRVASASSQEQSPARRSGAQAATEQRQMQTEVRERRTQAHIGAQAAQSEQSSPNRSTVTETVIKRSKEMTIKSRIVNTPIARVRSYVIETGRGNDQIKIERNRGRDRDNYPLIVTVNGERQKVGSDAAHALTIRAGIGNDRIAVGRGIKIGFTLEGNSGNDRIRSGGGNDRLEGGAGNDTISGGSGRDYLNGSRGADRLAGGMGNDVVYGGDGRDRLAGSRGNDYLEGSRGNDRIDGGAGRDVLSGGRGDDRMSGGASNDVLYAGLGRDRLQGGTGADKIYAQSGEDRVSGARSDEVFYVEVDNFAGSSVVIDPASSAEFRERVEADIDMLRASPKGQQMLREFDLHDLSTLGANRVYITELPDLDNGLAIPRGTEPPVFLQPNEDGTLGTPNTGASADIHYNTQFHMANGFVPSVILYHEMTHAYNMVSGTLQPGVYDNDLDVDDGLPNGERQAVGLPNSGLPFDDDRDPSTPPVTTNREALSENALRLEMGLPKREHYSI